MKTHALNGFPNEICGFFFGNLLEGEKHVSMVMPVENIKEGDQRRRFKIDPLAYMKAEQFALKNGVNLLGVYHTHPLHPAIPSEHDRAQALPVFSYVILSVSSNEVVDMTSWQLNNQRNFEEEKLLLSSPIHQP